MRQWVNEIHHGDVLKGLKTLPAESVDCVVTSPPYYGLRDYGVEGQIGLEPSFEEYLEGMLAVTSELKRVLKPTGTMWWNHGDAYLGSGKGAGDSNPDPKYTNKARSRNLPKAAGLQKCLMLQNYRLAQRMIDEQGWILRNIIVWHKPNCMPSSVKDRLTMDYEPIFFFTKSQKYWFEMQREGETKSRLFNIRVRDVQTGRLKHIDRKASRQEIEKYSEANYGKEIIGRNKRCVWKIPTKPYKEAHFATFPPALIETPIKAGCPEMICKKCSTARRKLYNPSGFGREESKARYDTKTSTAGRLAQKRQAYRAAGFESPPAPEFLGYTDCDCNAGWKPGIVLDPFMGSGTTALVARQLGRRWIGIELKQEYIEIAEKRLKQIGEQKKQRRSESRRHSLRDLGSYRENGLAKREMML